MDAKKMSDANLKVAYRAAYNKKEAAHLAWRTETGFGRVAPDLEAAFRSAIAEYEPLLKEWDARFSSEEDDVRAREAIADRYEVNWSED